MWCWNEARGIVTSDDWPLSSPHTCGGSSNSVSSVGKQRRPQFKISRIQSERNGTVWIPPSGTDTMIVGETVLKRGGSSKDLRLASESLVELCPSSIHSLFFVLTMLCINFHSARSQECSPGRMGPSDRSSCSLLLSWNQS